MLIFSRDKFFFWHFLELISPFLRLNHTVSHILQIATDNCSLMTELTVSITDNAAAELKNIRVEENIAAEKILRLGVKGGGCSGLSYILEFEEKTPFDEELTLNSVPVIIDKRQMMYLVGMELDYQYGLNNRGFIFNNPNAKTTCGCGTSFSA